MARRCPCSGGSARREWDAAARREQAGTARRAVQRRKRRKPHRGFDDAWGTPFDEGGFRQRIEGSGQRNRAGAGYLLFCCGWNFGRLGLANREVGKAINDRDREVSSES